MMQLIIQLIMQLINNKVSFFYLINQHHICFILEEHSFIKIILAVEKEVNV